MTDPMLLGSDEPHPLADLFIGDLMAMTAPKVLELGTKRWDPNLVTHHRAWAPDDALYVMVDIEDGEDVDLIMDAHDLTWLENNSTDAYISIAGFEHYRSPWVAAAEARRVLRPGGVAYIQTHMAFMNHPGYGGDFTRWTAQGLGALFEWAGFETVGTSMTHRVRLVPEVPPTRWNEGAASDAWLCVDGYFRKPLL